MLGFWTDLICITLILVLFLKFYIEQKWKVLEKWNIPHTKPTFRNLGHMKTVLLAKENMFRVDAEMKNKLGPVWGFYAGLTPHIVVHDPEILKELFIKQFTNFPKRRNQFEKVGGRYMNNAVNTVSGKHWKRIRSTLSPSFSSAKLKGMIDIVKMCTEKAIDKLSKKDDGIFDLKKVIGEIAMDVICSAAFGVDLLMSSQDSEEHKIITMSKKLFSMSFRSPKLFLLFLFPWLERYADVLNISVFPTDMMNYYAEFVNAVIKQRKNIPVLEQRIDLMQMMINAEVEKLDAHAQRGLTRDEIIGNAIFMLIAGNDTTGSTLCFLLFNLSTHPDVQNELIEEIDEIAAERGGLSFENINRAAKLDMCVNETLRMYAPTFRNARCGSKDVTIKGVRFPKNVIVDIPLYEIHHDPEIWSEPYKFRPERYLKQLYSLAFWTGNGLIHPLAILGSQEQ